MITSIEIQGYVLFFKGDYEMKVDKKIIAATIVSCMLIIEAPQAMDAGLDREDRIEQITALMEAMDYDKEPNPIDIMESFPGATEKDVKQAWNRYQGRKSAPENINPKIKEIVQLMEEMDYDKEPNLSYIMESFPGATIDDVKEAWRVYAAKKMHHSNKPQISDNNPFVVLGIDNQDLQKRFEEYTKEQGDLYYQNYLEGKEQNPDFLLTGKFKLSVDEIKQVTKSFRMMGLKYHPDKNPSPEAAIMFQKTRRAYDLLKNVGRFK